MRKAIICGSGIAGLSAAIALAKSAWSVSVFERSSVVREIGAGIFVKANSLRVLESFGVLDRIREACVVLREARTLDSAGHILQRRTLHHANAVWNIQRQLLIRALLDRAIALGASVYTNRAVEAASPDGTVRAAGGEHRADLVIAADGVNSVVRRSLGLDVPVQASRSGVIRLLVPRTTHEADDIVRESWSGRLRVGICPCTRTDVFVYLIAPLDDELGRRVPIATDYWSTHFPRLASEEIFERASAAAAVHHRYPCVATSSWVNGRIVLAGDAAHALPPTLGQGVGLALTNISLLAQYVFAGHDLHAALAAWEQDWRWITERTQTWSRRYDWITSEWPDWAYGLRSAVIWALGKSRRFNSYMRVADRVDAPRRTVLSVAEFAGQSPGRMRGRRSV
jgi:2-polyprenyl-6-methoxyphenol hydroxylase-like FAD-dependent oxidoreductase